MINYVCTGIICFIFGALVMNKIMTGEPQSDPRDEDS